MGPLAHDEESQEAGLDWVDHGEVAYCRLNVLRDLRTHAPDAVSRIGRGGVPSEDDYFKSPSSPLPVRPAPRRPAARVSAPGAPLLSDDVSRALRHGVVHGASKGPSADGIVMRNPSGYQIP